MNFNIFCLSQHRSKITISTFNKYIKNINEVFYVLHTKPLNSCLCYNTFPFRRGHISSAQQPSVATGFLAGQCTSDPTRTEKYGSLRDFSDVQLCTPRSPFWRVVPVPGFFLLPKHPSFIFIYIFIYLLRFTALLTHIQCAHNLCIYFLHCVAWHWGW